MQQGGCVGRKESNLKTAKKQLKVKKVALRDLRAKGEATAVKGGAMKRGAPVYMLIG